MHEWIEFNFHDLVKVRVAADAPTASQLEDMFAPFRAHGLESYDLTITGHRRAVTDASHGEHEFRYTDRSVYLAGSQVQIVHDAQGWGLHGTREMLTTALPLLDRIMVLRGAAMVHSATVALDGRGVFLPAWGGVGKTSTVAKLMRLAGAAFMGDDWAWLTRDGELLAYEKPMFIKPHHRPIYPHLFADKRKPLIPSRLSRPVARLTTIVHPFVTRYPKVAGVSRRWSPEHLMVRPADAFPDARMAHRAPLAAAVFVERFDGRRPVLEEVTREWMVARIVGNFHQEMALHSREVVNALGATGLVSQERFFGDKAAVVESGLAQRPTLLLRVPATMSADAASDAIVEQVLVVLAEAGVPAPLAAAGVA